MSVHLFDLCELYFGTKNFYDVLKISKNANEKQVRKAYHMLSLVVHPDRVEEKIKSEATEKFKVLGRIHAILSDYNKRKIYDETGSCDEDVSEVLMKNWSSYWRSLFKEITVHDIDDYEKKYKGSETEIKDLKQAYIKSKGSMDYILESVPFTNCEDEPRLHTIINKLIDMGEVPKFKGFTEESYKKKLRRKRKWLNEALNSEKLNKLKKNKEDDSQANKDDTNLAQAVLNRNKSRTHDADYFLNSLITKYVKTARPSTKNSVSSSPKTAKK